MGNLLEIICYDDVTLPCDINLSMPLSCVKNVTTQTPAIIYMDNSTQYFIERKAPFNDEDWEEDF